MCNAPPLFVRIAGVILIFAYLLFWIWILIPGRIFEWGAKNGHKIWRFGKFGVSLPMQNSEERQSVQSVQSVEYQDCNRSDGFVAPSPSGEGWGEAAAPNISICNAFTGTNSTDFRPPNHQNSPQIRSPRLVNVKNWGKILTVRKFSLYLRRVFSRIYH